MWPHQQAPSMLLHRRSWLLGDNWKSHDRSAHNPPDCYGKLVAETRKAGNFAKTFQELYINVESGCKGENE